jgi:hypothetical protein
MATKFWGPLGWMTLHSISAIYPENPNQTEKQILSSFMELFRETITCVHCQGHFTAMFNTYRQIHPEWNSSRFDFFLFVCRAHNTVNRRLDKPIIQSLSDCIQTMRNNTKVTKASVYRANYIQYLINNWSREQSGDGFIKIGAARQLKKINEEYFNPRDVGFDTLEFSQEASVVEFIPENPSRYNAGSGLPNAVYFKNFKVGMRGGRFRIR